MEIKEENGVLSVTQKAIYEIVKKEDEALINALKDYAKKNSTELRLLDEDKVKEIIKKGIIIYHAEEHKVYSHSYIRKREIEEKIKELENEIKEKRSIAMKTTDRVEARILNDQIDALYKAIEVLKELLNK